MCVVVLIGDTMSGNIPIAHPSWIFNPSVTSSFERLSRKERQRWKQILQGKSSLQKHRKTVRQLSRLRTPELISRRQAADIHLKELQAYLVLLDEACDLHHPNHKDDCQCHDCQKSS